MCCGPDTLLWFALSVFRVAGMIGIDGHVSFLPKKKKNPLDVTMPQAGCCVAGGLELGAGSIHGSVSVRGRRPASGIRLVRVSLIETFYRTPGALRVWKFDMQDQAV